MEKIRMLSLSKLTRTFYNNLLLYCTKIFIVMSGVVIAPMLLTGSLQLPPILGAVAAALSDLDNHLKGRVKNIGMILLIFFLASTAVELIFPYPFPFLLLCTFGTAALIMLGALGDRYATIAFGTLVLMVYTMLTFEADRAWYIQPMMLMTGALWYHLISLLFHFIWPAQPMTESLAECYKDLARLLELKSRFFDPDEGESIKELKLKLSISGKALTAKLDNIRGAIIRRLQNEQGQNPFPEILNYYLIAQTIYERTASVHVEYELLHKKFLYSDLLFRFQRLMMQQGQTALRISEAISKQEEYEHPQYLNRLSTRLDETIKRLKKAGNHEKEIFTSLDNLLHNLEQINALFLKMQSGLAENDLLKTEFNALLPQSTPSLNLKDKVLEFIQRMKSHLTPESEVFRHAIRMSFVMGAGYLIIWLANIGNIYILNGDEITTRIYWIILTAIFVCQPNSTATKSRIAKRFSGTVLGVIITIVFLQFSPSISLQALIVILSGTLFFIFSAARYSFATALITIMILIGFNLNDYNFIAPERLIDTMIGCGLAWIAARYILPDWRYYNLPKTYAKVATENSHYLDQIREQYHAGRSDNLAYLTSRTRASEADSELSSLFSALSAANQYDKDHLEQIFNNLCLNNTFLGYLSALGAHREKIEDHEVLAMLDRTTHFIIQTLQTKQFDQPYYSALKREIFKLQHQDCCTNSPISTILLQQLTLLLRTLPSYLKALFNA